MLWRRGSLSRLGEPVLDALLLRSAMSAMSNRCAQQRIRKIKDESYNLTAYKHINEFIMDAAALARNFLQQMACNIATVNGLCPQCWPLCGAKPECHNAPQHNTQRSFSFGVEGILSECNAPNREHAVMICKSWDPGEARLLRNVNRMCLTQDQRTRLCAFMKTQQSDGLGLTRPEDPENTKTEKTHESPEQHRKPEKTR